MRVGLFVRGPYWIHDPNQPDVPNSMLQISGPLFILMIDSYIFSKLPKFVWVHFKSLKVPRWHFAEWTPRKHLSEDIFSTNGHMIQLS